MSLIFDGSDEDIKLFLQEAEELMQALDEDIVILEKEGSNKELLQEIFRAAHTLKGSSGMLGHVRMTNLTHAMESLFDKLRKNELKVTAELIDLLLESLDVLRVLSDELITKKESDIDIDSLVNKLRIFIKEEKEEAPSSLETDDFTPTSEDINKIAEAEVKGFGVYDINLSISKECPMPAVRLFQVIEELKEVGELIKSTPSIKELEEGKESFKLQAILGTQEDEDRIKNILKSVSEISDCSVERHSLEEARDADRREADLGIEARGKSPEELKRMQAAVAKTVRVNIERLDNLMNLVGELVINKTRLGRIGHELQENYELGDISGDLNTTTALIGQITNGLQEEITKARMLPIEQVFNKFPRMVRDLARKAGKQVDFYMNGKETELDRSVIEEIGDPLIHILRNAVDHGIETAEERKKAKKPTAGKIILSARQEESYIVIETEDDGRGIDAAKLKAKGIEKGLIGEQEAERMEEKEAFKLMFMSGLSTSKSVTDVSGRGVGMDVVSNNVKKANGSVDIESEVGKGTKVIIKIPMTLAIVDALLVSLKERTYAIPLNMVNEVFRMSKDDVKFVGGDETTLLRGKVLPLLRLSELFKEGQSNIEKDDLHVVVVGYSDYSVGLIVDSLVSKQEIVIKSLGGYLGETEGLSGATILGDGKVALIVDIVSLIARLEKKRRHGSKKEDEKISKLKKAEER
ncbi:MAG TPA: chemotaxis protein CheA [Actinobacteria bacterium]|nr:chemotaxis protein CheA [Actinomycetota bacterium]